MRAIILMLTVALALAPGSAWAGACHEYDALGRLQRSTYDIAGRLDYALDANGNRQSVTTITSTTPPCPAPSVTWVGNGLAAAQSQTQFAQLDAGAATPPRREPLISTDAERRQLDRGR